MDTGKGRPASTIASEAAGPPTAVAIEVELFGVPRLLAGSRSLSTAGRSLREIAADLGERCPALVGKVIDGESGWLLGGYTFVVDERFTRDPACRLTISSSVLLVSSVAGG